jgi:hypothetical protein
VFNDVHVEDRLRLVRYMQLQLANGPFYLFKLAHSTPREFRNGRADGTGCPTALKISTSIVSMSPSRTIDLA